MLEHVVPHPHPAARRMELIADAEEAIRCFQECGWRLEKLRSVDVPGEPFRVALFICHEAPPPFDGIL
jgi:hypothetical protein